MCNIEDCDKAGPFVRGWCSMHYNRWKRNGDPLIVLRKWGRDKRLSIKEHNLKSKFGIDLDGYQELLHGVQSGKCAICFREAPTMEEMLDGRFWPVDHDHGCCPGRSCCGLCNRGILCPSCNSNLTELWQNKTWRDSALAYMKVGKI